MTAHAHHHEHPSGQAHDHAHEPQKSQRILLIVLALNVVYMLAEAIGGYLANSLALLSDAGHMLTDVAALGLSLFAARFAMRPATPSKTYGYHRMEILAALANGVKTYGTTIHSAPAAGTFGVTETPYQAATLSAGELSRLGSLCNFIIANGSGFGQCRSCRVGGLGTVRQ